ncbi:hypothetical protein ABIC89_002364 [Variovorax boronicumulans]|uniref:helix-turn-helix domain-containing protein n=1 Tax=Variovorax boronicumulans TaxID=436515 RepID=UPI00339B7CA4
MTCADGHDNQMVTMQLRVTPQIVSKWRRRFVDHRLDGLMDGPRSGAPRTVDDARVDEVIAKTLENMPRGPTHWSMRAIAFATGLSPTTVSRIWRAFGLQSHRQETLKSSTDAVHAENWLSTLTRRGAARRERWRAPAHAATRAGHQKVPGHQRRQPKAFRMVQKGR